MKPRRYKLLFDANMPPRTWFPILNSRHDVKHLVVDLKKPSDLSDEDVFKLAIKTGRLIVTFNRKDFERIMQEYPTKETGIISLSTNLSEEQIDKKLSAILSKTNKGNLYGTSHYLIADIRVMH